ncbi:MAG: McrC family protein [Sporichthyaceae bacterium]
MSTPFALRETERTPLTALVGFDAGAHDREAARTTVARTGARLRTELGLREDALSIVETPAGPMLRTVGVAGTITLGTTTFDIRPKHVEDANDPSWQTVLLLMLERASRRRAAYSRSRRLGFRGRTFVDQLAMGLAMELADATRHAEVRAYASHRAELGQLRGRLLVSEQLRNSLLKPHRVMCEVDELSADNPINRLLHWACAQIGALATQESVRRELSVQAARLPAVTHPVKAPTRLSFQLPRQYHHYAGAVELATAFARGLSTSPGAGNVSGAGFLVGTERLFESFVERSLAVALAGQSDWTVSAQERTRFAQPVGERTRRQAYYSRPDNVVRRDGQVALLVDAKYKRFADETDLSAPDRPSNGDLYQMAAACMAHDCRRALLVYPRMADQDLGLDWEPLWWRIDFAGAELFVGAVTVPLHLLAADGGLVEFDHRLRALVETDWAA